MSQQQFPWKTTIIAAVVVITSGLALAAYLSTKKDVRDSITQAKDEALALAKDAVSKAPEIAAKFRTGTITETFRESVTAIEGTQGSILEVASIRADETFARSEERTIAWGVYLGTTEAEIRAPVTFRYHIRLSDDWRLASRSNICIVVAPPIRPSLPPAIHTQHMTKRAASGWARFDKDEMLTSLEKDMTPILEKRAADRTHIALVREEARRSVAAFVRNWLLKEDHWRSDRFSAIIVYFKDEAGNIPSGGLAYADGAPTITFDSDAPPPR